MERKLVEADGRQNASSRNKVTERVREAKKTMFQKSGNNPSSKKIYGSLEANKSSQTPKEKWHNLKHLASRSRTL